ncbi:MAG: hypothetical protein WC891_02905 [Actinomycetota bacterium]
MPSIAEILRKHTRKRLVKAGLITHKRLERLAAGKDFVSGLEAEVNKKLVEDELKHMTDKDFDRLMRQAPGADRYKGRR